MISYRVVALILLTVLLSACSLAGRTFGTYVDDKVITGSVKRTLAGDHWRTFRGVNVDTYAGTVYLSGEVDTPAQKSESEAAAWRAAGVEQVINDLRVRSHGVVNASPRTTESTALQERLPGVRRLDAAAPGEPALAYDGDGAVVATVFVRPLRDVSVKGFEDVGPAGRPITYVSLYAVPPDEAQPEALVAIVLWHIARAAPTAPAARK
jgi:hyperosmotically inducible protein